MDSLFQKYRRTIRNKCLILRIYDRLNEIFVHSFICIHIFTILKWEHILELCVKHVNGIPLKCFVLKKVIYMQLPPIYRKRKESEINMGGLFGILLSFCTFSFFRYFDILCKEIWIYKCMFLQKIISTTCVIKTYFLRYFKIHAYFYMIIILVLFAKHFRTYKKLIWLILLNTSILSNHL